MKTTTNLCTVLSAFTRRYLLTVLIISFGINFSANAVPVNYGGNACLGGDLNLDVVMTGALPAIPPADQVTGSWSGVGYTFSNINDPNAFLLAGVVVGPNTIRWTATPSGNFYDITFTGVVAATSTVTEAVTVTQNCNSPIINHVYSGGTSPYTVTFSAPAATGPFTAPNGTTTVGLPALVANTTYTISSVRDASGCLSDGLTTGALPRSYTLTYNPPISVYAVTGSNVCAPAPLTIGLAISQNGVTYKLYETSNPVASQEL